MSELEIVRVDDVKWWMSKSTTGERLPVPICPIHDLRLKAIPPQLHFKSGRPYDGNTANSVKLQCAEGPHEIHIPRKYSEERQYVIDRIDAKIFKGSKVLNLDDEALPIANDKVKTIDDKLFVTSRIMESKRGTQVVIYAGEKGSSKKSQIFIDPSEKRLSFDHKDLHPSEVFLKVEATFRDGSKQSITRK